jgi:hypothetical protein
MRNPLKPLKKIKAKYNKDMLNVLIGQILNLPGIKNTKEIQQCFQLMAHEHAERHYAERLNESTKYRRRRAPKLWRCISVASNTGCAVAVAIQEEDIY